MSNQTALIKAPEETPQSKVRRWGVKETGELKSYFSKGLTIEQLAGFFSRSENDVKSQLEKLGLI